MSDYVSLDDPLLFEHDQRQKKSTTANDNILRRDRLLSGNSVQFTDAVVNHFDKHLNIIDGKYTNRYNHNHSFSFSHNQTQRRSTDASIISQSTSILLERQIGRPSYLVWSVTFIASISGFMFGYDTGYISSVLVTVGTDLEGIELSIHQKELISSATSFGALLTSFIAGLLADTIGRKFTILLCDLFFIIGAIMQVLTHHVSTMVIGRLIMGFGVGIGSLCAPLYISELAPGKFRGQLVVINCLAITGGQLIAYAIGAYFENIKFGWRIVVAISVIPCTIQFICTSLMPDTPRYLIMKERYWEAGLVLRRIYPDASPDLIEANVEELSQINKLWSNEMTPLGKLKSSWKDLFGIVSNRHGLIIACGLQAIQQFTGFNALMYFSASIFKMVGYDNSAGVSCFIAGTNFVTTCIALVAIDKIGRRRMLLLSLPFLCLSQLLCALAFHHLDFLDKFNIDNSQISNIWRYLLFLSMMSFVATYAIGIGNVPWQQSELFPQKVRGLGSSFSTATNWFGSMFISAFFLSLMNLLSPKGTFILFSLITVGSWIFIWKCYPELGGLTLEEVETILEKPWDEAVTQSLKIKNEKRQWANFANDSEMNNAVIE
ncbi:Cin10 protein [Martiniozyma asiatica (nom. inval.)]|nr:Cin10 protein [Martiniozyma asiatica]